MSTAMNEPHSGSGLSAQDVSFDSLFVEICNQLREKASLLCRRERSPIFATGDLVNDLYLKLRKHPTYSIRLAERSRLEFLWVATAAMRHVLTDAARKRVRAIDFVTLSAADKVTCVTLTPEQLIDLDITLTKLEEKHPRQAAIITMRFYGDLSIRELYQHFGVSGATVERDITVALKFMNALLAPKANV